MPTQGTGPVRAFLGLGANEGDRDQNLRRAVDRLAQVPGVRVLRTSSLRETAFVGDGPPQGPYRNGVVELETTLPPTALLAVCKALEREAGRVEPAPRNHPRPLDLDVLLYGDLALDTRDLAVPHPRLFERAFVLEPLAELGVAIESLAARFRRERPELVATQREFAGRCSAFLDGGRSVGLVPTMGALHDGHRSLFERARRECDRVVATIFVNPLQFGAHEDLAAYPRDLPGDLRTCREAGVDLVFAPPPEEMYAPGFCSRVAVGREAEGMEGASRPGHFEGVATVVARLFALARPHRAYFGQKDCQQVAVVRRMAADLGFPLRVVECPTVREPDGLARSSRNVYLDAADRRAAPVIHRALQAARSAFRAGERDRDALLRTASLVLGSEPRAEVDYLELRSEGDLLSLPPGPVTGGRLVTAVRFRGGRPVRLLDNLSLADDVGSSR